MANDLIMKTGVDDRILPYLDSLNKSVNSVSKSVNNLDKMSKIISGVVIGQVTWSSWNKITTAIDDSVESLMDYQKASVQAASIMRAQTNQVTALGNTYREVSSRTESSAGELAKASTELAKAGLNAEQVLRILGPAADAATTSMSDIVTVATTGADVMRAFSKETEELPRIMAQLAEANNMSSIGFDDLSVSMKYLNSTAQVTKVSLEEVLAMVAYMGNQGVKGSTAGTTLAKSMTALLRPDAKIQKVFDEQGIKANDGYLKRVEALEKSKQQGALDLVTMLKQFDERAVKSIFTMTRPGQGSILAQYVKDLSDPNLQTKNAETAAKMRKAWEDQFKITGQQFDNLFNSLADKGELDRFVKAVNEPLQRFISDMATFMEQHPAEVTAMLQSTADGIKTMAEAMGMLAKVLLEISRLAPVIVPTMTAIYGTKMLTGMATGIHKGTAAFRGFDDKGRNIVEMAEAMDVAKASKSQVSSKKFTEYSNVNFVRNGQMTREKVATGFDVAGYRAEVEARKAVVEATKAEAIAKAKVQVGMSGLVTAIGPLNIAIIAVTASVAAFNMAMELWMARSDNKVDYAAGKGPDGKHFETAKNFESMAVTFKGAAGGVPDDTEGALTGFYRKALMDAIRASEMSSKGPRYENLRKQAFDDLGESQKQLEGALLETLHYGDKTKALTTATLQGLRNVAMSKSSTSEISTMRGLARGEGDLSTFLASKNLAPGSRDYYNQLGKVEPYNWKHWMGVANEKPAPLVDVPATSKDTPSVDWSKYAEVIPKQDTYKYSSKAGDSLGKYEERVRELHQLQSDMSGTSDQNFLAEQIRQLQVIVPVMDQYYKALDDIKKMNEDEITIRAKFNDEMAQGVALQEAWERVSETNDQGDPEGKKKELAQLTAEIERQRRVVLGLNEQLKTLQGLRSSTKSIADQTAPFVTKGSDIISDSQNKADAAARASNYHSSPFSRNHFFEVDPTTAEGVSPQARADAMNKAWSSVIAKGRAEVRELNGKKQAGNIGGGAEDVQTIQAPLNAMLQEQLSAWSEYYSAIDSLAQESYQKQLALLEQQSAESSKITSLNVNQKYVSELYYERKKKELNDKAEAEHKDMLRRKQQMDIMSAISNIALGITSIWADSTNGNTWMKAAQTASLAAVGGVQIATISAQKFAGGGWPDGPGGRTQDLIPISVSPGERVVSTTEVAAAGGKDALDAMLQYGGAKGSGGDNFYIDNFIGNEEWVRGLSNSIDRIKRVA